MRDLALFEESIPRLFGPIAEYVKAPLFRVDLGIYEIPSPFFILRIRLDTGHSSRGITVTLRRAALCAFVDAKPGIQIGIGAFRPFKGEGLCPREMIARDDNQFIEQTKWHACEAERYGIPYLLGLTDEFDAVMAFLEQQGEARIKEVQQMVAHIELGMPKVRVEWPVTIPREKDEVAHTVNQLRQHWFSFLGEQTGEKEAVFKKRLSQIFAQHPNALTAYLVRLIAYGFPANAALCLRLKVAADVELFKKIGGEFADLYGINENLNVLTLTADEDSSMATKCPPFYIFGKPNHAR